ncbi:MAG: hypothetical protein QXE30_05875 [Candidatus Bathyarchaeia archaeon]
MLKKKLNKIDLSKLNLFINDLAERLNPLTLILHGSLVKKQFIDKFSNIDMIVISPKFENIELKEHFTWLLEKTQKYFPKIYVTAYTPQEFLKMIKELNSFALDAAFYSVALYDKNKFWQIAIKEFKKYKRKYNLKKTESDEGFGENAYSI